MDQRLYDRLKEAIRVEYEERLEALEKLRSFFEAEASAPPVVKRRAIDTPVAVPFESKTRRGRRSGPPLSDEERKEKKRAYMKAYFEKRRAGTRAKPEDEKGLPAKEFAKFMHRGPISAGGNGSDE